MTFEYSGDNLQKPQSFLKLLTTHYHELTDKNFFELFTQICENKQQNHEVAGVKNNSRSRFFNAVLCLLEEKKFVENIRDEVPVDDFVQIMKEGNDLQEMPEVSVGTNRNELNPEESKHSLRLNCEALLGFIIAYWNPKDAEYENFKQQMVESNTFLTIAFAFVKKQDENCTELRESLQSLEKNVQGICPENSLMPDFLFILLVIAMKCSHKTAVDCILSVENFTLCEFKFPSNMKITEMNFYVARKLLENGYKVGTDNVVDSWITRPNFIEFLDSRVKYCGQDVVEVDFGFVANTTGLDEDTNALQTIITDERINDCIVHPVMKTYIEVKSQKFRNIHKSNFNTFFLFHIIPLVLLLMKYFIPQTTTSDCSIFETFLFEAAKYFFPFSILFLMIRQVLLIKYSRKSFIGWQNFLEFSLIFSSCFVLWAFWSEKDPEKMQIYYLDDFTTPEKVSFIEIFSYLTAFLAVTTAFTIYPCSKDPIHLHVMKKFVMNCFKYLIYAALFLIFWHLISSLLRIFIQSLKSNENYIDTNETKSYPEFFNGSEAETWEIYKRKAILLGDTAEELDETKKMFKIGKPKKFDLQTLKIIETAKGQKDSDEEKSHEDQDELSGSGDKPADQGELSDNGDKPADESETENISANIIQLNDSNEKSCTEKLKDELVSQLSTEVLILLLIIISFCPVLKSLMEDLVDIVNHVEYYPSLKIKVESFIETNEKCGKIIKNPR